MLKKEDIQNIIQILDSILKEEDFSAYRKLKHNYINAIKLLENNSPIQEIKSELEFTIRILMEAPPKNKELGLQALIAMDLVYKKIESQLLS